MTEEAKTWPVAVVGAGAAGLLAAIFAARAGVRVLLLETRPVPGAKIRVSGGGRCNILPSRVGLENYHTDGSRHTLRNILFSWPLGEVRGFFERDLGLPLAVEETGKVFPASNSARDVVDALLRECRRTGVTLAGDSRVEVLRRAEAPGCPGFLLETASGGRIEAWRVVLATGGLSLPRTGSDGGGLRLARAMGHGMREPYPALVPLRSADPAWLELAGISLPARLRAMDGAALLEEREGDLLFTHRGFSGPVVLDLSRHVTRRAGGTVRLLAAWGGSSAPAWEDLLTVPGRRQVATLLRDHLPRRLIDRLMALAGVSEARATSELPRAERLRLVEMLTACPLPVAGDEGYGVAEVTGGGVPLDEVVPRTLESRIVPGLHMAGEMLDVVGHIGGYNFLWAWVTGRKAGEAAAAGLRQG